MPLSSLRAQLQWRHFPDHFDSIRHSSRFFSERKCNERMPRVPQHSDPERYFPDLYRFDVQFSALLMLQMPEHVTQGVTIFDVHWRDLLHDCTFTATPTKHNVHLRGVDARTYLNGKRVRRQSLHLQPGDVYIFNSNHVHVVEPVLGATHRLSLGTFVGFGATDMRVWS